MNTTLLFAELLIIGLQSSLWLFALTLVVFGDGWLQGIQATSLASWQTVIVITLLSFFYVLGILLDRLADTLFSRWDGRLRNRLMPDRSVPMNAIRFQVGRDNEYLNRHIEYMRSRIRIARASSINLGLTTVLVVLFIVVRLQQISMAERWALFAFAFILGAALTVAAVYSWHELSRGYYHVVKVNYDLMQARQEDTPAQAVEHEERTVENSGSEAFE